MAMDTDFQYDDADLAAAFGDNTKAAKEEQNHDILKPLRSKPKIRRFATVDIEATEWVNPYAVGFYDGKEYTTFYGRKCIQDSILFMLQPKYIGYWIYAHNGGNYDFQFFLKHLLNKTNEKRWKTEITPVGSCMLRFDVFPLDNDGEKIESKNVVGQKLKWTFLDSARLMPIRLMDLGETFQIGKKVELHNVSYDDLAKPENRPLMEKYLKQDCILLYQSITKIQSIINNLGGQLGPTLPSTSLDLYRRRYQKGWIYTNRHFSGCPDYGKHESESGKCQSDSKACGHEFIREAYFGGRAEIFRMFYNPSKGHEVAYYYDVNSMYPACMLDMMPVGPGIVVEGMDEKSIYTNAKIKTGIVDCEVSIPKDCYLPPLPVKADKSGKLIFPVGTFRGTWDAAELSLLPKVGGKITKVYKTVWFEQEAIFSSFVRSIYKFRDKTRSDWNKGMDWIAKILLNSAYGKFAMKEERSKYVINPDDVEGLTPIDFTADIWSEAVTVKASYIVPQLATHITSLARVMLWKFMRSVLDRGGRIYYCDTDSIVCSGVTLPESKKLGELKLEHKINRAEFVLPKLYLIEMVDELSKSKRAERHIKVKAKGMGPGIRIGEGGDDPLAGELSEKEFVDLVRRGIPIERHRLTKFKEGLNESLRKATTFPRVKMTPKQIRSQYDKRIVLDDYDTKPIVLGG